MGASGPTVKLADTLHMVPAHLTANDLEFRRSGIALPLRYAIISDTPEPAAAGAQNCTCKEIMGQKFTKLKATDTQGYMLTVTQESPQALTLFQVGSIESTIWLVSFSLRSCSDE